MKRIEPSETEIIGHYIGVQGQVSGDNSSRRVLDLITDYLERLGRDDSGWDTLYRDPGDNRLWELIYLQSELHGGGPPSLLLISQEEAAAKYRI